MSWLIESKHLETSNKHAPVNELSLICSSQSSITLCRLVCVECLFKYAFYVLNVSSKFPKLLHITGQLCCHCMCTLQWHYNGRNGISNHQPHHCLLNCLFKNRSKKTSKLRVTGLCEGNSPMIGEFSAQRASNAENVSIWPGHQENCADTTQHTESLP